VSRQSERGAEGRGGVTIGDVAGDIRNSIIAGGDVIFRLFDPLEVALPRARSLLLARVEQAWINGLRQSRLGDRPAFEVPADVTLTDPTADADIGVARAQHVLVLGEPGAGKTIYMLDMLAASLVEARAEGTSVPVMIAASAWRIGSDGGRKTDQERAEAFRHWLLHRIQTDYRINPRYAAQWLAVADMILYLDGLDEIDGPYRAEFAACLRAFQHEELAPIRLSCRTKEFEALSAEVGDRTGGLALAADVTVRLAPLSDEQIVRIATARGIVASFDDGSEDTISELCRSPLFLTLILDIAEHDRVPLSGFSNRDEVFARLIDYGISSRGEKLTRRELVDGLSAMAAILVHRLAPTFHYADLTMERFDRGWQTGAVITVAALVTMAGTFFFLPELGSSRSVKTWLLLLWATFLGGGLLFMAAKNLHRGFVGDPVRAVKGLMIGVALALALVALQLVVAVADIVFFALTEGSFWRFLAVIGSLLAITVIWGLLTDGIIEALQRVFQTLVAVHAAAVAPIFVLGWFITSDPTRWVHTVTELVHIEGTLLAIAPWGSVLLLPLAKLLPIVWRSDAVMVLIFAALGLLIGALRPRPMDRFTPWRRILGEMAASSAALALFAAGTSFATIALVQLAFGHAVDFDGRGLLAVTASLIGFAGGGGVALVYHALCYGLLAAGGTVPLRLPRVLDEAVRLGLIVRVAGSFAFLHRLELDYFAARRRSS